MISYYNTREEIEKSDVDTAIISFGSIEQHGPHLPIGTDFFQANAFAEAIGKKLNALVFPAIPFSNCYEHKGSKGTLGFRPQTTMAMTRDLVLGLHSQGFRKIVILLVHGGIFSVPPAVRELNALTDDLQVVCVIPHLPTKKEEGVLETPNEIHAGEHETSVMMYLQPDTVKNNKMTGIDHMPDYPQPFLNFAPILDLCPNGVWGNPSLASQEKGKVFFEAQVEATVDYIKKAFKICKKEAW